MDTNTFNPVKSSKMKSSLTKLFLPILTLRRQRQLLNDKLVTILFVVAGPTKNQPPMCKKLSQLINMSNTMAVPVVKLVGWLLVTRKSPVMDLMNHLQRTFTNIF